MISLIVIVLGVLLAMAAGVLLFEDWLDVAVWCSVVAVVVAIVAVSEAVFAR